MRNVAFQPYLQRSHATDLKRFDGEWTEGQKGLPVGFAMGLTGKQRRQNCTPRFARRFLP
jgi:hypothetical protein